MMKSTTSKFVICLSGVLLSSSLLGACTDSGSQNNQNASPNQAESAKQYVDSSSITAQVKAKLLADPQMKSFPITVNTYKNRVQLSGFVHSRYQSQRAEEIARSVPGVTSVENDLIIQ